ncbi:hypothetical protein QE152_g4219 [Popillia japonica]|uniref:Uncharacterized protein n=1 Tax=Popillia japonica TaxID=7064 RepID=A0AAW1N1N5_POPJA
MKHIEETIIQSDGESVNEFGESDDEENAATNMKHIEETIVAPSQNISDSEEDDEKDLPLSHLLPKDIFTPLHKIYLILRKMTRKTSHYHIYYRKIYLLGRNL